MATQRDYYDILGVPRGADDDDIKRSFRKLAQQWHPDVNTSPEADARFKEINEAYQVLSDPQRRQAYDMFGHAAAGAGAAASIRSAPERRPGRRLPGLRRPLRRVLRRRRRRRPAATRADRRGPALRPADHLRRVDQRRREGDRVHVAGQVRDVRRQRRRAGHVSRRRVPSARARASCAACAQTMLGQIINVTPCDRCRGTGKIVETPCHTCQGDGRVERKRKLRVTIPAGHRRQPPDPPLRRGRGRAARRRAGQPVRRRPRHAASRSCAGATRSCTTTCRCRSPRPRWARASRCPRPMARRRSRSSRARRPAPRSGCAARACRICGARARAATCT